MENEKIKQKIKNVLKKYGKRLIIVLLPIILLVVLLAASLYFITIDDGTYREDDWGSTSYGVSQYSNTISVNDDGSISNSMTADELWDKMIKSGCRVDQYLDSPKELARLMKAEIVTQYPDTRANPDEEISWEEIVENSDKLQGIIKFKRADSENNITTMKYADSETFQGYIDEYKRSGSETAKRNALTHFTLKKVSASTATGNGGAIAAGEGVMTDVSQDIINAVNTTPWPGSELCAKWVNDVFANAGLPVTRHGNAYADSLENVISTDRSAIPIGAAVYGTGTGSAGKYGHVGIYIGDGKVVDSVGSGIKTSTLDEWIGWQENKERNSNNVLGDINGIEQHGWLGWGWPDGNRTRGTTQDSSITQNNSNNSNNESTNTETAVEVNSSGDGYVKEYISSAGIKYRLYRQFEGSYSNNHYWNGTVHSDGCGPSSIAILASGILGSTLNPGDVAAQMNMTSYETLKNEMVSLGMENVEVVQNPSAEMIQENLRNGKVMLVSVNSNTQFTGNRHIMAILDINTDGQVYIGNPGSSTKYGWYDISEIMRGCNYIVVTDAGAAGIANSVNTSSYVAEVATWSESQTLIKTDDPNVQAQYGIGSSEETVDHQFYMTTTTVNYQEMVKPYTVPFDLLWAFMVVGEDKKFVFDFADLIYNSDIQVTIYDNLTVNTDIDDWDYTQRTRADIDVDINAKYTDRNNGRVYEANGNLQKSYDPDPNTPDKPFNTTKTVITKTNTINTVLTRANVWTVDYTNEYTYSEPVETGGDSATTTQDDQEYPSTPDLTESGDIDYSTEDIEALKQQLITEVINKYTSENNSTQNNTQDYHHQSGSRITNGDMDISNTTSEPSRSDVQTSKNFNYIKYYRKYINISNTITNKVKTQKYTTGVPEVKEKTDRDAEEPNFVTIYLKKANRKNYKNIRSVPSWLFEIIENNTSTSDMLDLIKYLLYKATGTNYGVKEFDFNSLFGAQNLVAVGDGDYIVNIDMSTQNLVITDVEKLKQAFSGYSASNKLQENAQYFLEFQERYRVNAVFAAAVSISETGAGRAGHAVDGKNNWFNIECRCGNRSHGRFETYSSPKDSIERFFWQIAEGSYYFKAGKYTVSDIGMIYCENADAPGGWIESTTTYMTQMFNAAGISPVQSAGTNQGNAILQAANSKLGCPYVWGAEGPNQFDCSGFTKWCYKQIGIDIPHNSESQKNAATRKVSVSSARGGDILWKSGHVAIYIGNGKCIEAPHRGDVVKVNNVGNRFTYALQFY